MAWTGPRTWVTGEIVGAPRLNTHIRDNLLETETQKVTAAGQAIFGTAANSLASFSVGLALTTAFTMNTQAAFTNLTGFSVPVQANEKYLIEYHFLTLHVTYMLGVKIAWTYPSGGSGIWALQEPAGVAAEGVGRFGSLAASGVESFTPVFYNMTPPYGGGAYPSTYIPFSCCLIYQNGSVAGVLQLQSCQGSVGAYDTKYEIGSHQLVQRMA